MTSTLPYIISLYISTMILRDISCNEILKFSEGENATLEFKHDLKSDLTFKIRKNQDNFYSNEKIIYAGLTESQRNRLSVIESVIPEENYVPVVLSITNVNRHDEANYTCQFFRKSQIVESLSQTIFLLVEFPVGPVQCSRVSNELNPKFDLWIMVECNATVGRYRNYIACYQFGEPVPSVAHVSTNILVQTMWVRKTQQLFCCSSSSSNPQNGCDCHNFVWDPVTETEVEGSIAPFCFTSSTSNMPEDTTPPARSQTPIAVTPSQSGRPTTQIVECSRISGGGFRIAFFIVFFIVFFILMILLGAYLCYRNRTFILGVLLNFLNSTG